MESDSRRILIATALSVAILMVWQLLNPPPKQPAEAKPEAAQAQPQQAAPQAAPKPVEPVVAPNAPEETVTLESPEFQAILSSWGGSIKSVKLKGQKFQKEEQGKTTPVDLVRIGPGGVTMLAMAASTELGGAADLESDPALRTPMRIVSNDGKGVDFEGRIGALSVRKRIELGERPYELKGSLKVTGADRQGAIWMVMPGYISPNTPKGGMFSGGQVFETVVPLCRSGDKTHRFGNNEKMEKVAGTANWIGLDQNYFVAAMLPEKPVGECALARGTAEGESLSAIRIPVDGGGAEMGFKVFAGPKRLDLLRAYGRDLDTAIDYGSITNFFAFFARILLFVMRWFYGIVSNWGVAIILLTLTVKIVTLPLTVKQMRSMNEMRKLQPEVEKIKAKFGADKEKLNQAVMQLYQQHKVNPLSGCLPMLIQLPIWFALYATLQTSVELYREPFLWIRDLTQHDPIYVLPLAMGLSMFVTQKISPQPADSTQAKMMLYFMPIFFTFIMLKLPAGLTLYILVNNLLSIVQQQGLMRMQAEKVAKTS